MWDFIHDWWLVIVSVLTGGAGLVARGIKQEARIKSLEDSQETVATKADLTLTHAEVTNLENKIDEGITRLHGSIDRLDGSIAYLTDTVIKVARGQRGD